MRVTLVYARVHAMKGSCSYKTVWPDATLTCSYKTVWPDAALTCPCQALTQIAVEKMAMQKRCGLKRGELIALYAVLWSLGSIAAIQFSSRSYKMRYRNQSSDSRHSSVQWFGCKSKTNTGGRGIGHSLTSVPFACSGHSGSTVCSTLPREESSERHQNLVSAIKENRLDIYSPAFSLFFCLQSVLSRDNGATTEGNPKTWRGLGYSWKARGPSNSASGHVGASVLSL